jgi:hypothetical protein
MIRNVHQSDNNDTRSPKSSSNVGQNNGLGNTHNYKVSRCVRVRQCAWKHNIRMRSKSGSNKFMRIESTLLYPYHRM